MAVVVRAWKHTSLNQDLTLVLRSSEGIFTLKTFVFFHLMSVSVIHKYAHQH